MAKQFISVLAILVIVLATSDSAQAGEVAAVYFDDFNTPHLYYDPCNPTHPNNTAGTIWDDFVGYRECETVDKLEADMNHPGQLYIESTNGAWDDPWCPLGPFLFKVVVGDFIATVKVTDYAGTEEEPVYHNDAGLMARLAPDPNENWVSIDYFPIWGIGNMVWEAGEGVRDEALPCHNGKGWDADRYLRLDRRENTFYIYTSPDGVNWEEMSCSPKVRDDFDGLPLQVGLRHATYSTETGYAAFDDFKLELIAEYKAHLPVPADKAKNQDPNVELAWTPGDTAKLHDIYLGTDEAAVLNASRPAGDVGGDGGVDWLDVFIVSQQWLHDPPNGSQPSADLDGDDDIDGFDFAIVAGDWAKQASDVFKGNQDTNSYYLGPLNHGTTHYWRIDEVNTSEPGSPWTGEVWSFTVLPLQASEPSPPNDAQCVPLDIELLSWTPGGTVKPTYGHAVFFGTSSPLSSGFPSEDAQPPLRTEPNYPVANLKVNGTPHELQYDTHYYWRVDEKEADGDWIVGDEWHFKTVHQIPIVDTNLVGWWKFDGASCADELVLDSSGYGHHGIRVNDPCWTPSGTGPQGIGGALQFDGKDDYVELPIGELIGSLTNCTLMMWMDSEPGGSFVRAFDFGTDDPNVYMCLGPRWWFMDDMYFAITLDDLGTGYLVQSAGFDPPPGWHHVAVIIDADDETMILCYDGYELARNSSVPICPNDLGVTTNNWLGRPHDADDDYYLGSMADFRIYDYAMTQEKIREIVGYFQP